MTGGAEFERVCFVVMPFGNKAVGTRSKRWFSPLQRARTVDFDRIYDEVFEPAIRATELPEGGTLIPKRADREFVSGDIGQAMFEYLEYSRFTVVDITGLNFNVAYELGHRHHARESGTVIFRQVDGPIPFDISHIRAFPYEYEPEAQLRLSRTLVTRVLTESLEQNRLDSPIRIALRAQRTPEGGHRDIDALLRQAEEAIRNQDTAIAIQCYRRAIARDPTSPLFRMNLGILFKQEGRWTEALTEFDAAIAASPAYADAHREKGIAENKLHCSEATRPLGEESLRTAITLQPDDFDALSSLGGILKRKGLLEEALETYRRATDASNGHPYPLLNEIAIQARLRGELTLDAKRRAQLERAERSLMAQVVAKPPYNPPWSFFDLAAIRLYLGDGEGFLEQVEAGIRSCRAAWEAMTFHATLGLLRAAVPGEVLDRGMRRLEEAANSLPGNI